MLGPRSIGLHLKDSEPTASPLPLLLEADELKHCSVGLSAQGLW